MAPKEYHKVPPTRRVRVEQALARICADYEVTLRFVIRCAEGIEQASRDGEDDE